MRIAVFSDSHGSLEPMLRTVRACAPDEVFHLGDHARDAELLSERFPDLPVRFVRGNCDLGSSAPERLLLEREGVKILLTHGHLYRVKFTMEPLMNAAAFSGAQLVLYGHTHQRDWQEQGGVSFLNPGAAQEGGSYALLELSGGQCTFKIHNFGGF